jgi:hypothetical protein
MANTRDEAGQDYFGDDAWEGTSNKAKPMFDFFATFWRFGLKSGTMHSFRQN